jgi:hypothetical protein
VAGYRSKKKRKKFEKKFVMDFFKDVVLNKRKHKLERTPRLMELSRGREKKKGGGVLQIEFQNLKTASR